MPWTITNQQLDDMTLTLDDTTIVTLPGGGNITVNVGIGSIKYHRLLYSRVGLWPFPDKQNLNASYPGQQNIDVKNPGTSVTAIYHYEGP